MRTRVYKGSSYQFVILYYTAIKAQNEMGKDVFHRHLRLRRVKEDEPPPLPVLFYQVSAVLQIFRKR